MTDPQIALLSAALRHTRDAEALLNSSPDQAWHLAGFGPECARKAALSERWADKAVGHQLGALAEGVLETAIAMDAHAARYRLEGWVSRWPALAGWRPDSRYNRTGSTTEDDARGLTETAREAVGGLVAELWADGALTTPEI